MIKLIDIHHITHAQAVLDVQIPAYQVEAALIGYDDIPALKDTVSTLQKSDELFYGYYEHNILCAIISFKIEHNILDIHRLVVHPNYFKRGIAQALLNFVMHDFPVAKIVVATGTNNLPAINLYTKNNFIIVDKKTVASGLSLTFLEKRL